MKKHLVVFGLSLVSSNVFAIPSSTGSTPTASALSAAIEVLNLPGENRRLLAQVSGDRHYKQFIALAFDESRSMALRWKALMSAADARGKGSTVDILKAAKSHQWYMRNAALVALQEVNQPEAEKLALELISDKALVVRSAAMDVLGHSSSFEARETLWSELDKDYNFKKKQSLWIRNQIVEALAKKPLDKERLQFTALLKDSDERVQMASIQGLEKLTGVRLGDGQATPKQLVSDWNEYMKKENSLY